MAGTAMAEGATSSAPFHFEKVSLERIYICRYERAIVTMLNTKHLPGLIQISSRNLINSVEAAQQSGLTACLGVAIGIFILVALGLGNIRASTTPAVLEAVRLGLIWACVTTHRGHLR